MEREKIIEVLKKYIEPTATSPVIYAADIEAITDELLEQQPAKGTTISNRQKKRIIVRFLKYLWREEYDSDIEKEIADYLRPLE